MKIEYTYEFANGDKATISIEQSDFELLNRLDHLEHNANRRETRRHKSLDALGIEGTLLAAGDDVAGAFEAKEQRLALISAFLELPPKQQKLIRQVFYADKSIAEIARRAGKDRSVVSRKLARALRDLRKLLLKKGTVRKSCG